MLLTEFMYELWNASCRDTVGPDLARHYLQFLINVLLYSVKFFFGGGVGSNNFTLVKWIKKKKKKKEKKKKQPLKILLFSRL